jgi:NADPH2:quinone reductase
MRAVWYEELGTARSVLQIGEIADPHPAPGEVRVRVSTSGVNPVDVKRRAGGRGDMTSARVVPHFDGAGTIDEVGDGVSPERVGERVWVYEAQWNRDLGTAAEFVTLPAELAVRLPEGASFSEGACLGIPALTAHRCVYADGGVRGQTILVTGGAGAVGRYAVQFASLDGAEVIATVSGDDKAESARAAGAHHIVNYRTEDVAARVQEITGGAGVDRVVEVEFGGNLPASLGALKIRGVVAAYASQAEPEPSVPFYQLMFKNITVRHVLVFQMPESAKRQAVTAISRWLSAGSLTHEVGPVFDFDQVVEAHEAVESGAFGKVLLRFA